MQVQQRHDDAFVGRGWREELLELIRESKVKISLCKS